MHRLGCLLRVKNLTLWALAVEIGGWCRTLAIPSAPSSVGYRRSTPRALANVAIITQSRAGWCWSLAVLEDARGRSHGLGFVDRRGGCSA